VIPGLGQIYNEQPVKGFVIMLVFILFILSFVGVGFALWSESMRMGISREFLFPWQYPEWLSFHSPFTGFFRFPSLTLVLLIVIIYCYAIFDAATTASRINRGEITLHPARSRRPRPTAKVSTNSELRKGAAKVMDTSETVSTQAERTGPRSRHGRFLRGDAKHTAKLGWALLIVGVLLWGQMAGPWWLRLENTWPIVPLLFGLRLLHDYRRYQEQSQLLLGLIFTTIGAYFLLDNVFSLGHFFTRASVHWPLILIALAAYLIWVSRKTEVETNKNQTRNGEE